jgi:hypothetical protein
MHTHDEFEQEPDWNGEALGFGTTIAKSAVTDINPLTNYTAESLIVVYCVV